MPKNYDHRNTRHNGGKVTGSSQPRCKTCGDTKHVRVSKKRHAQGVTPRQQYDIVTERCPDC